MNHQAKERLQVAARRFLAARPWDHVGDDYLLFSILAAVGVGMVRRDAADGGKPVVVLETHVVDRPVRLVVRRHLQLDQPVR